jgi:hypothetical protein
MPGVYSTYYSIKTFISSLLRIVFAVGQAWLAWFIGGYGIRWMDWDQWLAYGCLAIAAFLAIRSVCNFFESLPGLTQSRAEGGAGTMRTATRDDLREGGLFGRR